MNTQHRKIMGLYSTNSWLIQQWIPEQRTRVKTRFVNLRKWQRNWSIKNNQQKNRKRNCFLFNIGKCISKLILEKIQGLIKKSKILEMYFCWIPWEVARMTHDSAAFSLGTFRSEWMSKPGNKNWFDTKLRMPVHVSRRLLYEPIYIYIYFWYISIYIYTLLILYYMSKMPVHIYIYIYIW